MRLVLAALALAACADPDPAPARPDPANVGAALLVRSPFPCRAVRSDEGSPAAQFPVPKPPFSKGVFPCTRCHDKPDDSNPTPRILLAMHSDVRLVHGSREQWCYDCHNPSNRDMLRLAGGRLVSFETSYELCGQCHGEKLRDWRVGIHGRRIGCWNGPRQYLLCVNCHNPHSPHFKPLHPLPRPMPPGDIQIALEGEP
jgi:hypothetical protein